MQICADGHRLVQICTDIKNSCPAVPTCVQSEPIHMQSVDPTVEKSSSVLVHGFWSTFQEIGHETWNFEC